MKNVEPKKPGVYPLPDGRTETVLEVQKLTIDISALIKSRINLRVQELLNPGATEEAKNG